ncbi:MAG: hypothetical protein N5P05_001779 [Chroococcopsis gigantea SAG 12.99]|nr:hypothetical protein [Chroococcopsis gigantea SAG 12.99]
MIALVPCAILYWDNAVFIVNRLLNYKTDNLTRRGINPRLIAQVGLN